MTPQPVNIDWQAHNQRREQFAVYLCDNARKSESKYVRGIGHALTDAAAERLCSAEGTPEDFRAGLSLALANYRAFPESLSGKVAGQFLGFVFLLDQFSQQTITGELNRHLD